MCEPADASPCFTVHLARVTQVLLNAKLSLAAAAAAETGHFLFAPHVSRVIPGELGAGLHDPERDNHISYLQESTISNHQCRLLRPPHLLVKKAMTGKAGSWESVKTFWMNRFGWQLCCRAQRRGQRSKYVHLPSLLQKPPNMFPLTNLTPFKP